MNISGAIFDMDGTLTDSMFIWKDIVRRYLISCGITPLKTLWENTKNKSAVEVTKHFREVYGLNKPTQEIANGIDAMVEPMYREGVLPKDGIFLLLDRLKARGVKMCVASATDLEIVEMVLDSTGLRPYFSAVFSCVTVGAGKDEPLIFEKALSHLGTPKDETFVFEDALYAIKTAKSIGFPVAGVYDSFSEEETEQIKALSDIYIQDFRLSYGVF